MKKHLLYAALFTALFGVIFAYSRETTVWLLFLALAGYHAYRAFRPAALPVPNQKRTSAEPSAYGVLGMYVADEADPDDKSYGLYIRLNNMPVLVDIREDEHLEARKATALAMFRGQEALGADLVRFIEENPEFKSRQVGIIGLHAPDMNQGEVFWDPHGYTLLKGGRFISG
jgi:hypothetical protein